MKCALIPQTGKVDGAIGCCEGTSCVFRVSCIDRSNMDDCGSDCKADPAIVKW